MSDSTKYMWVVRPTDDRDPAAPFAVWSSEDGRMYADLDGRRYELVKSGPETAAPHIARAARIDELKLMIGSCIGVSPWGSELAVTMRTLRERLAELEAESV